MSSCALIPSRQWRAVARTYSAAAVMAGPIGRTVLVLVAMAAVIGATGCGGAGGLGAAATPDKPVGKPVLPDLAPKPQLNVLVQKVGSRWRIRFETVLVNV